MRFDPTKLSGPALVLLIGSSVATGAALTPAPRQNPVQLTTFVAGTPAVAAEVNANFEALRDRSDLTGANIVDGTLTGADIEDGSLTGADISTSGGTATFNGPLSLTGTNGLDLQLGSVRFDGWSMRSSSNATRFGIDTPNAGRAINFIEEAGEALVTVGTFSPSGRFTVKELGADRASIFAVNENPNATSGTVVGFSQHSNDAPFAGASSHASVLGVLLSNNPGNWNAAVRGRVSTGANETKGIGVAGYHSGSGMGVYGEAAVGGFGVYGKAPTSGGSAVYADGRLIVTQNAVVLGNLTKASGTFQIDHPLDPENKTLSHSFVESPEMKNLYDGIVVLDDEGRARVQLPDWFSALNRDYRYQLTPIGAPGTPWVETRIGSDNAFTIRGEAGLEVSWCVTGVRDDAYARKFPTPIEEDKSLEDRGTYLHPEAFGLPESRRARTLAAAPSGEGR